MLRLGGMANADIWGDNSLTLFPMTFLLKLDKGHLSEAHKIYLQMKKKKMVKEKKRGIDTVPRLHWARTTRNNKKKIKSCFNPNGCLVNATG